MKLFTTQISWNEPWFFILRIREGWGWRRRLLLALGVSVIMFLAIFFFSPVQRSLPGTIGISLLAGFVLIALLDVGNLQREVTVKEDSIYIGSAVGWGWEWSEDFKLSELHGIQLMRPEEWGKRFGGMVIQSPKDHFLVAIPNKVSLETLADILHRLGVRVTLSDWQPPAGDTRIGVKDEIEIDPSNVHGEIEIQPVGAEEPPLLLPGHLAVQVVIALGPLLIAFIAAIVVGVLAFRNWAEWSLLDKVLAIGGALAGIVVGFVYLVKIGQFLAASYGIRIGRQRLQDRTNALFEGREENLVCIEIFDRKSWTATIAKSADYGFLQMDEQRNRLVFEGNKFRWTLPASAVSACRIEESLVGTEAATNPEKRYFVVLEAKNNGEPWEAGIIYTRTELGSDTPESRYNRARLLFTQLADFL